MCWGYVATFYIVLPWAVIVKYGIDREQRKCYDLAKQLSYYLIFLLLLGQSMGKYHMTVTESQNGHITGHGHSM